MKAYFKWYRDEYDYDHNISHEEEIELEGVNDLQDYFMYDYLEDHLSGEYEIEELDNGHYMVTTWESPERKEAYEQYYSEFYLKENNNA